MTDISTADIENWMQGKRLINLNEYSKFVKDTDKLDLKSLTPVLQGLYGEVGGIMTVAKKYHREQAIFAGYKSAVEEEFGDALWYLSAVCRRLGIDLEEMFTPPDISQGPVNIAASDRSDSPITIVPFVTIAEDIDPLIFELGKSAACLLDLTINSDLFEAKQLLRDFVAKYVNCLRTIDVSFTTIINRNVKKTIGRFVDPKYDDLPKFDDTFPLEEQLPEDFEIEFFQRKSGKSYLRWNGVFIGDPLTDNIRGADGYRFHDVFHLTNTAILHWSPTTRALLKLKRKSRFEYDVHQDGGRAIVVEEGLTAWIFSYAKAHNFFKGQSSLPFDLLKTVQKFVTGFEVDVLPAKLWETSILTGYELFRQLNENEGGVIMGSRTARTIKYKKE